MTILPETTGPAVRAAIAALDSFGAVTQRQATQLLGFWARYPELTADDIAVVLSHYGDRGEVPGTQPSSEPEPVPPLRQPGYVTSHRGRPPMTAVIGCGLAAHGWYGMTETSARDNTDRPCPDGCFSGTCPPLIGQVPVVERFGIPRQRRGRS